MWNAAEIHDRLAAHGDLLGAPLDESAVRRFEEEHGVRLPDDYRSFLLEVGDGGAGPDSGLHPLRADDVPAAEPFPHTAPWDPEEGVLTEDEYFDDRWIAGSLPLAEVGCGHQHRIVVTGPARGQVWLDVRSSDGGIVPEGDFREWYLAWLNDR